MGFFVFGHPGLVVWEPVNGFSDYVCVLTDIHVCCGAACQSIDVLPMWPPCGSHSGSQSEASKHPCRAVFLFTTHRTCMIMQQIRIRLDLTLVHLLTALRVAGWLWTRRGTCLWSDLPWGGNAVGLLNISIHQVLCPPPGVTVKVANHRNGISGL